MSLPQRIYELGRDVANCQLVQSRVATPDNMTELQNLLNQSWPVDAGEEAQRDLVRGMYYGNPVGFLEYISMPRNRVRSLILWTESKRIAKFFHLNGCVHISWDETSHAYNVVPHVARERREPHAEQPNGAAESSSDQPNGQGDFVAVRPKNARSEKINRPPRNLRHERNESKRNESNQYNNEPTPVRGVKSKRNLVGMVYKQARLDQKREPRMNQTMNQPQEQGQPRQERVHRQGDQPRQPRGPTRPPMPHLQDVPHLQLDQTYDEPYIPRRDTPRPAPVDTPELD